MFLTDRAKSLGRLTAKITRYVAPKNTELLREENLKQIEEHIDEILRLAKSCKLSGNDIIEMVKFALEE